MSLLDTIVKGSDNPLNITVSGVNLLTQTDIEVIFGAETYTLLNNPDIVIRTSETVLSLNLGGTAETKSSHLIIKVFNTQNPRPEGYTITNKCLGNLPMPKLCT